VPGAGQVITEIEAARVVLLDAVTIDAEIP
jgi:hypothetical protein